MESVISLTLVFFSSQPITADSSCLLLEVLLEQLTPDITPPPLNKIVH